MLRNPQVSRLNALYIHPDIWRVQPSHRELSPSLPPKPHVSKMPVGANEQDEKIFPHNTFK